MNANPSIDRNMLVADVLAQWPRAVPLFLKHRMYCVGCVMARFDTLSDAAKIYGVQLDGFLAELRQTIDSEEGAA